MTSASTALSLPSTSTLIDPKVRRQSTLLTTSMQCSGLPVEPSQNRAHVKDIWRSAAYCRKLVRNVITMTAAGDAPAIASTEEMPAVASVESMPAVASEEVAPVVGGEEPTQVVQETEMPDIVKTVQAGGESMPAVASEEVAPVAGGEEPIQVTQETEMPDIVKTVQAAWDKVEDKYAVSSLAVAGVVALWGTTGMISAIDRLPLVPGAFELVGIGYSGWFAYKNLIFKPERDALLQKIKSTFKEIIGSN